MFAPRHIGVPYEEVRAALLVEAGLADEERNAQRFFDRARKALAGVSIPEGGHPSRILLLGPERVAIRAGERWTRVATRDLGDEVRRPLEAAAPEAAARLRDLAAALDRWDRLRERLRLVREIRETGRRRDALARLESNDLAAADRRRLALLGREMASRGIAGPAAAAIRALARPEAADPGRDLAAALAAVPGLASDGACALVPFVRPVDEILLRAAEGLERGIRDLLSHLQATDEAMARDAVAGGPASLARSLLPPLADLVEARLQYEYRTRHTHLSHLYTFVNLRPEERHYVFDRAARAGEARFLQELAWLMEKANYVALTRGDLERAMHEATNVGIKTDVDLGAFDEFHFYVRGWQTVRVPVLRLTGTRMVEQVTFDRFAICCRRKEAAEADAFADAASALLRSRARPEDRRRFLRAQLEKVRGVIRQLFPAAEVPRESRYVLRIFRDVNLNDAELIVPDARIRYRLSDIIAVSTGIAGGTAWTILHQWWKRMLFKLVNPLAAGIIFLGGIVKGILGFRTKSNILEKKREEYVNQRLQATGIHVIDDFVREAAESEKLEALLAYFFLAGLDGRRGRRTPLPSGTLGTRVARFIWTHFHQVIDFDVPDAIETLERLGLVHAAEGTSIAARVPRAAARALVEERTPDPPSRRWDLLRPWRWKAMEKERYAATLERMDTEWAGDTVRRDAGGARCGVDFLTNGPRYADPFGLDPGVSLAFLEVGSPRQVLRHLSRDLVALLKLLPESEEGARVESDGRKPASEKADRDSSTSTSASR